MIITPVELLAGTGCVTSQPKSSPTASIDIIKKPSSPLKAYESGLIWSGRAAVKVVIAMKMSTQDLQTVAPKQTRNVASLYFLVLETKVAVANAPRSPQTANMAPRSALSPYSMREGSY